MEEREEPPEMMGEETLSDMVVKLVNTDNTSVIEEEQQEINTNSPG